MKVYHSLTEAPDLEEPISLCIGIFDGVHKGHQKLLTALKGHRGTSIVLTFSNHPLTLLRPEESHTNILTAEQKIQALQLQEVDVAIILPFSKDIAQMSYQIFLTEIHKAIPFKHLYVGEGDAFGKNREGTKENLISFAPQLGFIPHYVEKLKMDDQIISSTWIRKCLKEGDVNLATKLLGREPSFSSITKGVLKPGKYPVRVLLDGERTFTEQIIHVEENGYELEEPGIITLIDRKD
ncbi:MAG: Bifunctional riboflavin kinase/FMN adenylyltransferase [Chlamydiia bacterium]|nr:Bifunctional riboflavin kinase/FMN adenylyltransferase [Chlamydiia bacterium]